MVEEQTNRFEKHCAELDNAQDKLVKLFRPHLDLRRA
jgi:hypothetical protein